MSTTWMIITLIAGLTVMGGGFWLLFRALGGKLSREKKVTLSHLDSLGWHFEEDGNALIPWVQEFFDNRVDPIDKYGPTSIFSERTTYKVMSMHGVVRGTYCGYRFIRLEARVPDSQPNGSEYRDDWKTLIWVQLPVQVPYLQVSSNKSVRQSVKSLFKSDSRDSNGGQFDLNYEVLTSNKEFENAVLTPPVKSYLADDSVKFREVTFYRDHLGIYGNGAWQWQVGYNPTRIIERLDVAVGILSRISPHVWRM